MPYIFKQKLQLDELVFSRTGRQRAVIAENERYLSELYKQLLSQENFEVFICAQLEQLLETLARFSPSVLIVNPKAHVQGLNLLKTVNKSFPGLPIVTLGQKISAEEVKEFMDAGVSSHLDRAFTKPQDLVEIVKILLNN